MIKVAPSILSADFSNLEQEVKALDKAGADMIHIDVMDGHFVPNLTFGPCVIKSIRSHTDLPFDVHLMITNPEKYINDYIDAGANIITIHKEATERLHDALDQIKAGGGMVGIAMNPSTSPDIIDSIIDKINHILVMTVNPGFAGQSFMKDQLDKIKILSTKIKRSSLPISIAVDGGINDDTARECVQSGANILVAGNFIFQGGNYRDKINKLKVSVS